MTEKAGNTLSAAEIQAIFDRSPFIGWLGLDLPLRISSRRS